MGVLWCTAYMSPYSHETIFPLTFLQSVFDLATELREEELFRRLGSAAWTFGLTVFFTQCLCT